MNQRINEPAELSALLGLRETSPMQSGDRVWSIQRGPVPKRETVLLIAGLGMHRIEWSAELIRKLQRGGYETITVDNHDAGLSHLRRAQDAYSLADIARDLVDLLDVLALERVHVVGISMGGMIAQHVAMAAPERTASLTSLSSTTGRRGVGRPAQHVKWIFKTPLPTDHDPYLEYVRNHHVSITTDSSRDVDRASWLGEQVWQRGLNADGYARQLAAIGADGDRTERLGAITVPTLVVHGDDDPMIDISGGQDTADAIPSSRFVVVPGMGHVVTWHHAATVGAHLMEHFAASGAHRRTT